VPQVSHDRPEFIHNPIIADSAGLFEKDSFGLLLAAEARISYAVPRAKFEIGESDETPIRDLLPNRQAI
jgi:hypothetical protein